MFICLFGASEIPHGVVAQSMPRGKRKSPLHLLLQCKMTDTKIGITQQWRSIHFLSGADKSWPVPLEGYELLARRGDRKQAENWTSAVLYQTHTCILALVLHMKKEQTEINEGWCHVNLTLRWRCLNKDLETPKYRGVVRPSEYADRRFRKSEKKGKGHAVSSLWASCHTAEQKSALGTFPHGEPEALGTLILHLLL